MTKKKREKGMHGSLVNLIYETGDNRPTKIPVLALETSHSLYSKVSPL